MLLHTLGSSLASSIVLAGLPISSQTLRLSPASLFVGTPSPSVCTRTRRQEKATIERETMALKERLSMTPYVLIYQSDPAPEHLRGG